MTFSVIMMSYLGYYHGARSNPILKFNRAVRSFVNQTFKDCELIIVSDGCELTNQEYKANWANHDNITLIKTKKSEDKWPGVKRQLAREVAKGEWIIYLDSDDLFLPKRIENINKAIKQNPEYDLLFDNSLIYGSKRDIFKYIINETYEGPIGICTKYENHNLDGIQLYRTKIDYAAGTCSIAHKNTLPQKWDNRNRRGEDLKFIAELKAHNQWKVVDMPGYVWCHSEHFDI